MKHPFKMNHILKNHYIKEEQHTQTVNPLQIQNQCHRIIINKWKINHHNHKSFNNTRNSNSTPRIKMYQYKK